VVPGYFIRTGHIIPRDGILFRMKKETIIVGGGAAGLMCALVAGQRGRSVLVIEHNPKVGRKIAISGGGRCNFTNTRTEPSNFISANPRFAISALSRYTPNDFISLIEKHKIRYHEKKLGQLFCDHSSQQVIDMLIAECDKGQVEIITNCQVRSVSKENLFRVVTSRGDVESESLVIATGGLSIPKIGATDFGYRIASQYGINVIQPRPALVPLLLENTELRELTGVSLETVVESSQKSFRENILFTHKGLSGPAILQISSYWSQGEPIYINLLPDLAVLEELRANHQLAIQLNNFLSSYLPKRLADKWCELYASSQPLRRFSLKEFQSIAERLHRWEIVPTGTEGYTKAEVTAGGVDTNELSSKSMESRKVPGLFFIGEVVDVTGQLGGYNFQWAWASGYAAGQYV
jgi:predicted Rossmann fold flavoprotein